MWWLYIQTFVAGVIPSEGQIPSYDISCVKAFWSSRAFEDEFHVGPILPKRREILAQ